MRLYLDARPQGAVDESEWPKELSGVRWHRNPIDRGKLAGIGFGFVQQPASEVVAFGVKVSILNDQGPFEFTARKIQVLLLRTANDPAPCEPGKNVQARDRIGMIVIP